jgi:hypothetical protein
MEELFDRCVEGDIVNVKKLLHIGVLTNHENEVRKRLHSSFTVKIFLCLFEALLLQGSCQT